MNFGAMLSGVAPGFQKMEQVQIGQEANRIREDELAMNQENLQMQQMRELGQQGLATVEATIKAALEQGVVDPQGLAKANAHVIKQLEQLDAIAGTNNAQQAAARINGLSSSAATSGGYEPAPDAAGKVATGERWKYRPGEPGEPYPYMLERGPDNMPVAEQFGTKTAISGDLAGKGAGLDVINRMDGPDGWGSAITADWSDPVTRAGAAFDYATGQVTTPAGAGFKQAKLMVEGILRSMTGAAAPNAEQINYANMFAPKPWDLQETRKLKLQMAKAYKEEWERIAYRGRGPMPGQQIDDATRQQAHAAAKARVETITGKKTSEMLKAEQAAEKKEGPKVENEAKAAFKSKQIDRARDALAAGTTTVEDVIAKFKERGITVTKEELMNY